MKKVLHITALALGFFVLLLLVSKILLPDGGRKNMNMLYPRSYDEVYVYEKGEGSAGMMSGATAPSYANAPEMRQRAGAIVMMDAVGPASPADRKVIRSASLSLVVADADQVAADMGSIAMGVGGWISNANIYEVKDGINAGSVQMRVPADKLDGAISAVRSLALDVEREDRNASDVTAAIVDIEARLANLRAAEEQYVEIMDQAVEIEDVLAVSRELTNVRAQIESMEAELEYLSKHVEMATLTASFTEETSSEVLGIRWRPLNNAKLALNAMIKGLAHFVDGVVRIVLMLPILAAWFAFFGIIAWMMYKFAYWLRKTLTATPKKKR